MSTTDTYLHLYWY